MFWAFFFDASASRCIMQCVYFKLGTMSFTNFIRPTCFPVIAAAPSVVIEIQFFKSTLLLVKKFTNVSKMFFPVVEVSSFEEKSISSWILLL